MYSDTKQVIHEQNQGKKRRGFILISCLSFTENKRKLKKKELITPKFINEGETKE
jgi:hypothetical protein